jgi:GT2 family glycosyltransferase
MSPTVAVCITTHNRQAELVRTLNEIGQLDPPPQQILVAADGCSDGTVEWLQKIHPRVKLIVHPEARGSIPSRNELAAACTSEVFLSLDDDSYPLERDCLARVAALFAGNERLAVASFPQRTDEHPETLTAATFGEAQFVGSYANSAAAIRVSAFRELGGYPDFFFHAYEEPDFALRCVAAGWEVRYETAVTVRHHFTATERNEMRTHQRHARNELWSVLLRCPVPQLFAVAAFRAARQFGYAWRRGLSWAIREPQWWLAFLGEIPRCLAARAPLPWSRYVAWMKLLRTPLRDRAEWATHFSQSR